jgi:hypothetical protein
LTVELFSCLAEAQVLIEDWRVDDNQHRPHSALGMRSPAAFAASILQPPPDPTPTAAGEGAREACPSTSVTAVLEVALIQAEAAQLIG